MSQGEIRIMPAAGGRRSWNVVYLSFRLCFERLGFLMLLNLWTVLLCIPVVTAPAAVAALTVAVREGLLAEHKGAAAARGWFRAAFFRYLGPALALAVVNLVTGSLVLLACGFWFTQEPWYWKLPGVAAGFAAVLWWLCQPLLWPALVDLPEPSVAGAMQRSARMALAYPLDALYVTLINTILLALGVVLLGPILLVVPALLAVISVQTFWFLQGRPLPAWDAPPLD